MSCIFVGSETFQTTLGSDGDFTHSAFEWKTKYSHIFWKCLNYLRLILFLCHKSSLITFYSTEQENLKQTIS